METAIATTSQLELVAGLVTKMPKRLCFGLVLPRESQLGPFRSSCQTRRCKQRHDQRGPWLLPPAAVRRFPVFKMNKRQQPWNMCSTQQPTHHPVHIHENGQNKRCSHCCSKLERTLSVVTAAVSPTPLEPRPEVLMARGACDGRWRKVEYELG